jgi:LAS superfamily LD-carboxypeptidase LdcB
MLYLKTRFSLVRLALALCFFIASPGLRDVSAAPRTRALDSKRINALDDDARVRLKSAMREMRKRGIRPRVNSTFRSHAEQKSIYRCARNRRCRARRGIYGAKKPGTSMHEAGLAVDIGGMTTGRRRRRLTPKGRQTVRIMRKHGFAWRYGLKDPAHFELSPRRAGYRTEKAAIKAGQRRWLKNQSTKRRAIRRA